MRILDSTSTALPFPDVVVQQYSCETTVFPLQTLMSQASSQITKCTNQQGNSSKWNQTTSANRQRHLMLTRLSITYNVYPMKDFKWAEKNKLAVSGNSCCFTLSHSTPDHPVLLPSSFRFMKPLGVHVETYGIAVKTRKAELNKWVYVWFLQGPLHEVEVPLRRVRASSNRGKGL